MCLSPLTESGPHVSVLPKPALLFSTVRSHHIRVSFHLLPNLALTPYALPSTPLPVSHVSFLSKLSEYFHSTPTYIHTVLYTYSRLYIFYSASHAYIYRERSVVREGGMDESVRSCKRSVEEMGAVLEFENIGGGENTRDMDEVSSKRQRSNSNGSSHSLNVPATNLNFRNSSIPANSSASTSKNTVYVHEQSSDVVISGLRSTDLKVEDSETESSTFTIAEFRETSTASSELCRGDSGDVMESSSTTKSKTSPRDSQQKLSASKMPSAEEIEVFFAAAEKYHQKRFVEKYNYDIVNDVPLKGRYEWIHLKP